MSSVQVSAYFCLYPPTPVPAASALGGDRRGLSVTPAVWLRPYSAESETAVTGNRSLTQSGRSISELLVHLLVFVCAPPAPLLDSGDALDVVVAAPPGAACLVWCCLRCRVRSSSAPSTGHGRVLWCSFHVGGCCCRWSWCMLCPSECSSVCSLLCSPWRSPPSLSHKVQPATLILYFW